MDKDSELEARLINEIENGRVDEIERYLLEHLARYGPGNLDVQDLACQVLDRIEEG